MPDRDQSPYDDSTSAASIVATPSGWFAELVNRRDTWRATQSCLWRVRGNSRRRLHVWSHFLLRWSWHILTFQAKAQIPSSTGTWLEEVRCKLSPTVETFLSSVQCPFWLASHANAIKVDDYMVKFALPGEASNGVGLVRFSVTFSLVAAFCFCGISAWRCNL